MKINKDFINYKPDHNPQEDSHKLRETFSVYGGVKVLDDVPLTSIAKQYPFYTVRLGDTTRSSLVLAEDLAYPIRDTRHSWQIRSVYDKKFNEYLNYSKSSLTEDSKKFLQFLNKFYDSKINSNRYYFGMNNYDGIVSSTGEFIEKILKAEFDNSYQEYSIKGNLYQKNSWANSSKYAIIVDDFFGNQGNSVDPFKKLRTFTAVSDIGFLGYRKLGHAGYVTEPVVMITVKPELVGYVKKCIFLGEDIHPDALTITVRKGFDHKSFVYKGLRSAYRKNILKPAKAEGIEIKEVDKIELVPTTQPPAADSRILSAKAAKEKDTFLEFMEHLSLNVTDFNGSLVTNEYHNPDLKLIL